VSKQKQQMAAVSSACDRAFPVSTVLRVCNSLHECITSVPSTTVFRSVQPFTFLVPYPFVTVHCLYIDA